MKLLFCFLITLFISFPAFSIDSQANEAIVIDWDTNETLFEKNADQLTAPASMTKIMTVYVVFDRLKNTSLSIEDTCTISAKAYKKGGSKMFVEINEKVSVGDLLRGIIIQSGNDASIAIAECLSGTEDDFSKLMNVYAKKIGMKNSNFVNASGWPEDKHFSTVRDIAILSNFLIRDFPDLYSYFNEREFTYNEITQPNRNRLLDSVLGVDGLKTGYTRISGWGISVSALKESRRVTVVINGTNSSRQRLLEAEKLINWAFRETSQKKILEKNQIIKKVDTWLGNKPTVNLVVQNDIITTLSYDQIQLLTTVIEYEKPISSPFNKGDVLGKMFINIPGKQTIEVPLVADIRINNINPFMRIFAAAKYLIFGTSLDE
jgi:D-alanyl-D-alanine carboxypeptidase (penicillin-binding protein 5/6)